LCKKTGSQTTYSCVLYVPLEPTRRAVCISTSHKSLLAEREKWREKGSSVSFARLRPSTLVLLHCLLQNSIFLSSQQDSFLYPPFSRIHLSSNLSFIHYWAHTSQPPHPPRVPTYLSPSSHCPLPTCSPLLLRLRRARRCCSSTGGETGVAAAPAPHVGMQLLPASPSSPTSLPRSPSADLPTQGRSRGEEDVEHRRRRQAGSRMRPPSDGRRLRMRRAVGSGIRRRGGGEGGALAPAVAVWRRSRILGAARPPSPSHTSFFSPVPAEDPRWRGWQIGGGRGRGANRRSSLPPAR
jgi:hypothetical protein